MKTKAGRSLKARNVKNLPGVYFIKESEITTPEMIKNISTPNQKGKDPMAGKKLKSVAERLKC
jgi:hypothetical protein